MNNYLFSDVKIGYYHSFTTKLTLKKMNQFLEISGDNNPMHLDSNFAIKKGMKERVVYGMLSSAYYSTLVGVYLPGKFALLHSIDIQFSKPVYIDDTLTIHGEISKINEVFRQIEIKAYIVNNNNIKVSRAKIKVGFTDE